MKRLLMKNIVFHKHEKFYWSIIENKLEICIWNFLLKFEIFLRSFMNSAPGLQNFETCLKINPYLKKLFLD